MICQIVKEIVTELAMMINKKCVVFIFKFYYYGQF